MTGLNVIVYSWKKGWILKNLHNNSFSFFDFWFLKGFLVTPIDQKSCYLGYVAHSDPGGHLPSWVTNKLSSILAPKMIKRLHKACLNYVAWKVSIKTYSRFIKNVTIWGSIIEGEGYFVAAFGLNNTQVYRS